MRQKMDDVPLQPLSQTHVSFTHSPFKPQSIAETHLLFNIKREAGMLLIKRHNNKNVFFITPCILQITR